MRNKALSRTPKTSGLVLAGALGLLGACAATPDAAPQPSDDALALPAFPSGPMGQTLARVGFRDAALAADGTPIYLAAQESGANAVVLDGQDARQFVRGALADAYRLAPGTDLSVRAEQRDPEGRRYLRLTQLHDGVPVYGAELVVQAEPTGAVRSVHGKLVPELPAFAASARRLPPEDAVRQGLASLGASNVTVHGAARPWVYAGDVATAPEPARAAVGAVVEYDGPEGHAFEELLVDAGDGAVLARIPRVYHALNRSIYNLSGGCIQLNAQLPGTLLLKDGTMMMTNDKDANQVRDAFGSVYWWYYYMMNRDSLDDAGFELKATVHVQFPSGLSCSPNNAAWLSDPYNQMAYGDGDGKLLTNLAAGFDVTAHEMTHGVTAKTSNLTYRNESGALNEANSDIIGAAAEAWVNSGGGANGSPATITANANTWKIGEDVAGPMLPWSGGALRFMNNPTADQSSRDFYADRYSGTQDNGGVHWNSGIGNLAFYLVSEGGKHPRAARAGATVKGVGIAKAGKIFERANIYLFTASTNFQMARYATAQAAQDLYGRCTPEWVAYHTAWDAVGVSGTWARCPRTPSGF